MAAIRMNRISSSIVGVFVVALAAALLVGGGIGYLVRPVHAPQQVSASSAADQTVRDAAQLPASIERYLRPAEASPSADDLLPASERQYLDR